MPESVQAFARFGGILLVLSVIAGGFGEAFAPSQILVPGDAQATAHNIVASNSLFRAGFAAYTVEALCDVALTVVIYLLIRPASPALSIFFVLFHVMATAVFSFAEIFYFVPAFLLGDASYLRSFTAAQLDSLALLSFNVYAFAAAFSQLFYAIGSMLLGYLIYRSDFLPRTLGVLWVLAGMGFAAGAYAAVLAPAYDSAILRLPTIIAVPAMALWLLVRGVDVSRWRARARSMA